ncbi:MAG: hypothetical protein GYB67_06040 [Chloroflexi bacterium]|nr:hypothetical protein [Chloroflexota bacterium]
MPVYEYRCNSCGRDSALYYKSYRDYDAATPACPHCGSTDLTRRISTVAIQRPGRDYSKMSSDDMLSVMESGDSRQLGEMMHQLGQDEVVNDPAFSEVTKRLRRGDDPDRIERDLSAQDSDSTGASGGSASAAADTSST